MVEMSEITALQHILFAASALYSFLWLPLTLGLSVLLVIAETIYVCTGNKTWHNVAKFLGLLFIINFVISAIINIRMEFQFATNWQKYSNQASSVFDTAFVIEVLIGFLFSAALIVLWFFGWDKLSKTTHYIIGWLMALGVAFSAIQSRGFF